MELWNSHELCKAVNGKSLNNSFWQANSISIDTRSIKDGGVFFALKGNKVDGHKFINHAFENGAIAVVANKKYKIEDDNKNIINLFEFCGNKFMYDQLPADEQKNIDAYMWQHHQDEYKALENYLIDYLNRKL